jgi:penicillin amidase
MLTTSTQEAKPKSVSRRLILKRTLYVIGFLVVGMCIGIFALLRQSLPQLDGKLSLPGLHGDVSVDRDELGLVTLRGDTRLDLARATGFVHAQDRFFQMDLMRRAGAGELAGLLGPGAIDVDKTRRIHRFRATAADVLRRASHQERELLVAYAHGVNAGLGALNARPFEYMLLGQSPRPWRPEDTYLVIYSMYFQLHRETLPLESRVALMHEALPKPLFSFLTQPGTQWDAPLEGGAVALAPIPTPEEFDTRRLADPSPPLAERTGDRSEHLPEYGSNGWVVSGVLAAGSGALLANDMHLGLGVPNVWYRLRLVGEPGPAQEPLDISGLSLPGTPVIVAGSNTRIAWGFTNRRGDWGDLVLLDLDPDDPDRYLTAEGYKPFQAHTETIEVKGGEPVSLTVRQTIWGPVVDTDHRGRLRAYRWLAHSPEATNLRLTRLESVNDVEAALALAPSFGMPPQNLMVADHTGSIGWSIAGRIPRRLGYDPSIPVAWSGGDKGWFGWLDPSEYPRIVNPDSGLIWTANARVLGKDRARALGANAFALGVRATQIRNRLMELREPTVEDMLRVQLDDRAMLLEGWHKLFLGLLTQSAVAANPKRAELRALAKTWTGRASVESAAYRVVRTFRTLAHDAVFSELTRQCLNLDPDFRFNGFNQAEGALWQLITSQPMHLLSPRYTDWDAQLLALVDETYDTLFDACDGDLGSCTWGAANTVRVNHPLTKALPMLAPWLNMPAQALPGDLHVPRVQRPSFGASQRFALSPGREAEGYLHMPAGQSGHPLSPFYRAGHEQWVHGEATSFLPGQTLYRLKLTATASTTP